MYTFQAPRSQPALPLLRRNRHPQHQAFRTPPRCLLHLTRRQWLCCYQPMSATELNPNASLIMDISPCAFPARQAELGPFANHDIRSKAIVPLVPPFFIPEDAPIARAAAVITTSMMIITGDDLQLESSHAPQWTTYQNAAGKKYWVMVSNTSHYLVGDSY